MKKILLKKKEGTGATGYVFLFFVILLMVVLTLYLASVAKLMTHQHHVDDALADSVLASLVADDVYYFETYESTGTPVIRFMDTDESRKIFADCMMDDIAQTDGFYYNFGIDTYICYEVEGEQVKVTEYAGNAGNKMVTVKPGGSVTAPTGEPVTKTSAYARVRFDIKSIIDGSFMTKTKDIYCTLKVNH